MPCIAPYPDWTPCPAAPVTGVGGVDVSAQSLCLPHYRQKWGESAVPTPAKADPATVLLLHGEALADEKGHVLTAQGAAAVSTAQSKFGGSSLSVPFTGTGFLSPDSPDWAFGAGDFTLEAWVYFNSAGALRTILGQWQTTPVQYSWIFRHDNGILQFYWSVDGTTISTPVNNPWAPALATWYHVAVVRTNGTLMMFINGTQLGSTAPVPVAFSDVAAPLGIGCHSQANWNFDGYLDEVRISKTARWTSNFTPPSAPYN